MGRGKIIRWLSQHGSKDRTSKTAKDTKNNTIGRSAPTHKSSSDEPAVHHTLIGAPSPIETQCKQGNIWRPATAVPHQDLLTRRGAHQSTRNRLVLQPNKRTKAIPVVDPDFFDETPATAMLMLENLSTAPPGSPCGSLSPKQEEEMLEMLCPGRLGGEETPICESTPKSKTANAFGDAKARKIPIKGSNEPLTSGSLESESPSETSPSLSGWPSEHLLHCYNDTSDPDISRLEDLSRVSPDKMSLVARLNGSMIEIDKVFDTSNRPRESCLVGQASRAEHKVSATGVPLPSPSSVYSQSSDAEPHDAKDTTLEDRDPCLYLAWTSMPAGGCSPRTWPWRKVNTKPCPMPLPHPKIAAAEARINAFKSSPAYIQLEKDIVTVQADQHGADDVLERLLAKRRIAETSTTSGFKGLLKDLEFVRMYTDEMKVRCQKGVWWEGWIIIEDLIDRGVAGSDQGASCDDI